MFDSLLHRHKPDILDCIANLSNDEVFTPPAVANKMLDLLPPDVWTNPELRFLDPGCKSGVFLREAAKRLMKGLEVAIPDEAARREHIFKNMLHGIAITELTAQISRRTLYYSKDASSEQSVVQLPTADGNIRYQNIAHTFKAGSCIHCGAPEAAARDLESLESHAYLFIHEELDPAMKFDVIIGNPPYQLGTQKVQENGKRKANAKPIYNYFVARALQMRPRYVSMIIPSRWFNSDLSELRAFRALMQKQPPVRLIDLPDENDAFPGIECKGGVCYFLTDLAESGEVKTQFEKFEKTEVVSSVSRVLSEFDDIFREPEQYSIVKKVIDGMEPSLSDMFSAQTPFGLLTNFAEFCMKDAPNSVMLYVSRSKGLVKHVSRAKIQKNQEWLSKHLVLTTEASEGKAIYPSNVIGATFVAPPGTACTQSYLVAGTFDDALTANNYCAYLKTKFARFLIDCVKNTQHLNKNCVKFVPQQDWSMPWTDAALYAKYGFTESEIAYVEARIKEMA